MDLTINYIEADVLNQENLEAKELIKTAKILNNIINDWDKNKSQLEGVLNSNYKFWEGFAENTKLMDKSHSKELKDNIEILANFILKKTRDILTNPTPDNLNILIDINLNTAKGLSEAKSKK